MSIDRLHELWQTSKIMVRFNGQISADAMHVNLGILGFIICLWLFRRSKRAPIYALIVVVAVQVINETTDILFDFYNTRDLKEWNSIRDTVLTLFWPSVFVVYTFYISRKQKLQSQSSDEKQIK